MSWLLLIINGLLFMATPSDHALYIGVVKINCIEDRSEVLVQVFKDDLQDAIRQYRPNFQAAEDLLFCEQNQAIITQYFNEHLQCKFDDQAIPLYWQEGQSVGESYLFHFQLPSPPQWQQVIVVADFLMELFPTQSNVVQIKKGEIQRYGRTTVGHPLFSGQF